MTKAKVKDTKGNRYEAAEQFAKETLDKHAKQPAQNNPAQGVQQ
ncbi:hypothetical protein [Paenibacillus sp. SYP-B4298]|nr:hypothetical protein [Paenibacillus sp. SYP-B4298]